MSDKKKLFKPPYDIKDVSVLFGIVSLFLIILGIIGNDLFRIFQENVNLWIFSSEMFDARYLKAENPYFSKIPVRAHPCAPRAPFFLYRAPEK